AEYCSGIMLHGAGLAVHQARRLDDSAAEGGSNGLMSQAYAQDGNFSGEVLHQWNANAGFLWSARAGRKQDTFRCHRLDVLHCDLVIAANFNLLAQLAQELHQVVGERIVVVENEDHGKYCIEDTKTCKCCCGGWFFATIKMEKYRRLPLQ